MRRSSRRSAALVSVALCALAFTAGGCGLLEDANRASASKESTSSSASPSHGDRAVPLYWLGPTANSTYLFREYRHYEPASAASQGDVVATAVSMMSREQPLDPDYRNPWKPASSVGSSISPDGVMTLSVSSDMFDHSLSEEEANLAVQQMIYTATAAASAGGVAGAGPGMKIVILVDGHRGYHFANQELGQPMVRDEGAIAPLWIIDPAQDEKTKEYTSVKMVSSAVAATVHWEITGEDGKRAAGGEEQIAAGASGLHEIQFSRKLAPGKYTIRMYARTEDLRDPSLAIKGEEISLSDDHNFTVDY